MDVPNGFISADDHVQEHPRVWTDRLSKSKWGERIPHIKLQPDGTECWFVDGHKAPFEWVASVADNTVDVSHMPRRWEDVPSKSYVPAERLKAMDLDKVAYSVLYPTVAGVAGEFFGRLDDPTLELECIRAYNDWLIEEWSHTSKRFVPQCIVPIHPAGTAVKEIKRSVKKGHRGVIYPAIPMHLRQVPHINNSDYDPIWATCQELGVPVCFHAGSSPKVQLPSHPNISSALNAALQAVTRPASAVFDVANVLFSRILLRYPRLNVIFAESTIGWGAFLLEYADHQFEQDRCQGYELKPSEMFKRQCFFTSWYDQVRLPLNRIGAANIMWATNFPFPNSTWPNSWDFIKRCFKGVSEDEQCQILWRNAAKLYGIDDGFGRTAS
jgi:uncharacterized protein